MLDQDKNEFVPVPLPFQVPEPPDLSKLPLGVVHSATVEALISQTEDLSARLKVQIRRNAVLERKALELEETSKTLEKELKTLQHQNELFSEKESTQNNKIRDLQSSIENSQKDLELLEIRYSELSALSQKKEEEQIQSIDALKDRVQELERLLPLEQENFKLQDESSFLKKKIEELCNYLQKKEEEAKEFRGQITQKNDHCAQLEKTILQLQQQVEYNRKAIEEKTEMENLLILKEREKEHATQQMSQELMAARQELKNLQMLTRGMNQEKMQLDSQLKSCEETITGLSKDNSDLEKQIENLQNLWYKMQAEHEKEKIKTTALTKLNRELSVELQRSRNNPSYEDEFLKKYVTQGKNIEV